MSKIGSHKAGQHGRRGTRKSSVSRLAVLTMVVTASVGVGSIGVASAQFQSDAQGETVIAENTAPAPRIIRKETPTRKKDTYFRKAATETPSGFPVPRYVSLKFGKVNGRTGPSRDHSIAWQYRRRGLPLIIVAETEMWRKVRDVNGDEAWVRRPALSGERFVLTTSETNLRSKPKDNAKIVAATDAGALLKLEECNQNGWCRVTSGNGIRGWTSNRHLWGAQNL